MCCKPQWKQTMEKVEDDDESFSDSGESTGSEPDYDISPESSGSECDNIDVEAPVTHSAPPPSLRRKSQNVDALVRFVVC